MRATHSRLSTETFTAHASRHGSYNHRSKSHLRHFHQSVVEKLRINSSIEQLKSLLSAEFLQQPDSKLEKADILEMTVSFLTLLQQQKKTNFLSQSHTESTQQSHCTELHNHTSVLKQRQKASEQPPLEALVHTADWIRTTLV